jgi:hypothetical protein
MHQIMNRFILLVGIISSFFLADAQNSKLSTPQKNVVKPISKSPKQDSKTGLPIDNTVKSTSFFNPNSDMSILSTQIEVGGYPSDADISFVNIYSLLGLNFDINRVAYVGPFFKHNVFSTTDYQVTKVEGRQVDVASFNEWGAGVTGGVYLKLSNKLMLSPELRIGYNEYTLQDQNYSLNKAFLNHTYISFNPRVNFGLKLSDYSILGFNSGYTLPRYMSGSQSGVYNPATFSYGLFLRFYLPN